MKASFKLTALSIALLVSVPASAISLPKLSLSNAVKTGVVGLIGVGAVIYYFKTQKTQEEITENKYRSTQEVDAVAQTLAMVDDLIGQDGRDDKPARVDKSTGDILPEKTPATGLGAVKKFVSKKVMPVATCLLVVDEARTKLIKGMEYFGVDLESVLPKVPNLSK